MKLLKRDNCETLGAPIPITVNYCRPRWAFLLRLERTHVTFITWRYQRHLLYALALIYTHCICQVQSLSNLKMADHLQEQLSSLARSLTSNIFLVADVIDKQADTAATAIRELLSGSTWVPEVVRPVPRPSRMPVGIVKKVARGGGVVAWVKENKWAVGIAVGTAVGVGGYVYAQGRKGGKKKRARKASDGGRKEVVG